MPTAKPSSQPNISKEISLFVQHLDALASSMPLVMLMITASAKVADENRSKFLKENCKLKKKEGENLIYSVPVKHSSKVESLRRKSKTADLSYDILPKSFVVSIVSQFDFFLSRLIQSLFSLRPELLDTTEKKLTFSELTKFKSIEDVKEYVLEKEVEGVLRKSHSEQFDWLENKFSIPLRKNLPAWKIFIEVTERRNLFVHCNGIVSSQYLSVCKENGCDFPSGMKVGDTLRVDPDYFKTTYRCIFEIGTKLAQVLWRKLRPDQLKQADESIIDLTFDLLKSQHYHLACVLLDFACDLKNISSNELQSILVINRAQAYKWRGNQEKCNEILNKEDWSACDPKYQLAVSVLLDDFGKAAKIMRQIGSKNGPHKHDYIEWPLFKEFRKSDLFQKSFKAIFKESFDYSNTTSIGPNKKTPPTITVKSV